MTAILKHFGSSTFNENTGSPAKRYWLAGWLSEGVEVLCSHAIPEASLGINVLILS